MGEISSDYRNELAENLIYFSNDLRNALISSGYIVYEKPIIYRNRIIGNISNLSKSRFISFPPPLIAFYGIYIEPEFLIEHSEKSIEIIKEITNIQKNRYIYTLFSLPPEITDVRAFLINGWRADIKYTYRIRKGNEILKKNVMRKIKKIDKKNLIISRDDNINNIYDLMNESNKNKGRKIINKEYLYNIFNNLKENRRTIYSLYLNNTCISSAIIIRDSSCSYLFANGMSNKIRNTNLNLYFISNVIETELSINNYFDLQGANTPSINRFKENFNVILTPYFHLSLGYNILRLVKVINKIRNLL